MVRVTGYKHGAKRQKLYYKAQCPYCESWLIFEFGDIWWDQPSEHVDDIGRIECPICRTKVHVSATDVLPIVELKNATEEEYHDALSDTSKSGLELLMAEKKKETENNSVKVDLSDFNVPEESCQVTNRDASEALKYGRITVY